MFYFLFLSNHCLSFRNLLIILRINMLRLKKIYITVSGGETKNEGSSKAPSEGSAYRAIGSIRFAWKSVSWISFETVTSMDFTEVTVSFTTKG